MSPHQNSSSKPHHTFEPLSSHLCNATKLSTGCSLKTAQSLMQPNFTTVSYPVTRFASKMFRNQLTTRRKGQFEYCN